MILQRRLYSLDDNTKKNNLKNAALLAGGAALLALAGRKIDKAISKRKKYLNASEEERENMEKELELEKQKDLNRFAKVIGKIEKSRNKRK